MPARAILAIVLALCAAGVSARDQGAAPFLGFRALVVEPENSWGWDTAILSALKEEGFDVTYGRIPVDPASLDRYALVALSIKRHLTDAEAGALERYVAEGGAVYGSWGGPMGAPGFLEDVCKVGRARSVWIKELVLLESPLTAGLTPGPVALPEHIGHTEAAERGYEIVSVEPVEGGVPVASDPDGNALGVLAEYGKGRTAVLGFGPEQDKRWAEPDLAPTMFDNLLGWLLEEKLKTGQREWSGRISVALPARARVREVLVDGRRVAEPAVRRIGSLRTVELDVSAVPEEVEVEVQVRYQPLQAARNVDTVIHLPWGVLRAGAKSPARLADYVESLNATICQPLLRDSGGRAWYAGVPEDRHDELLVAQYEGNFLEDLIRELHGRGIKVIGGVYFDNVTPLRRYPEVKRIDAKGEPVKSRYDQFQACFNNPKGQEHTLATIRHLLDNYDLDGLILDDNFELDKTECYCQYCRDGYRRYCEGRGIAYEDPAGLSGADAEHWRQYKRERTRELGAEVRRIAAEHGLPAGGWTGASMDSVHLFKPFEFLGLMVYTQPPRAARAMLEAAGQDDVICLLWAPDSDPRRMEREVRDAVHTGCAAVGFWIRGEGGGYEMDPERTQAMRRALGSVEEEWLDFYRANVVSGDGRFAVLEGKVGREELRLRIRNTGSIVSDRISGRLDVSALQPAE